MLIGYFSLSCLYLSHGDAFQQLASLMYGCVQLKLSQLTRALNQRWSTVYDAEPTLIQRLVFAGLHSESVPQGLTSPFGPRDRSHLGNCAVTTPPGEHPANETFKQSCVNPLTVGAAYIRIFIFYWHIKYHVLNMLKIKCDINQQYLKTADLHFVKSE